MPRRSPLALCLLLAAAPAPGRAQPPLTEADGLALAARQATALNAANLDGYFAAFSPDAVFVQQALGSNNEIVPYGRASLTEARVQLQRTLARAQIRESVEVRRTIISASGRGGALRAVVRTRVTTGDRVRESCAERLLTFARLGGRVRALAQTDTLVRCRRPA